jgi:O-antigen ligase
VEKTLLTAVIFLLYAAAGLHVIRRFRRGFNAPVLLYGIAAILLLWTFDALVQYFAGSNLLGWPYNGRRVTGIFHPDMRIGIVFAHLAPFFFAALHRSATRSGHSWVWLLLLPFVTVILLSGSRASWVTLALVSAVYTLLFLRQRAYRIWNIVLLLALAVGGSLQISDEVRQRVAQTTSGFSTDVKKIDDATSARVAVWQGAWKLFLDAPLTGNGVEALPELGFQRGYTYKPFGHAHFYALDVLLVTGIIGFIAYLTAFAAICRKGIDAFLRAGEAFPFWLAAVAMMFPFNMHWEFYGVRPYAMLWLFLILAFAVAGRESAAQRGV